jgi:hypothetical protein
MLYIINLKIDLLFGGGYAAPIPKENLKAKNKDVA